MWKNVFSYHGLNELKCSGILETIILITTTIGIMLFVVTGFSIDNRF